MTRDEAMADLMDFAFRRYGKAIVARDKQVLYVLGQRIADIANDYPVRKDGA